jgi:hypothetical protein
MSLAKITNSYYIPYFWHKTCDLDEITESLKTLEQNQRTIENFNYNHYKEVTQFRTETVQWLITNSKSFNLKNETLFKAIQILDLFIASVNYRIKTQEEFVFNAVVCLNIACKVEEINCNYLIFLKENLLNKSYTKEEFIKQEMEVLKTIKFKTNLPNFYHFNSYFMQIAISQLMANGKNSKVIPLLISINDTVAKNFVPMKECIFSSPLNSGLIVFKASLLALNYILGTESLDAEETIENALISVFCEEYLKRSNVVAFNLFTHFVNSKKFIKMEK